MFDSLFIPIELDRSNVTSANSTAKTEELSQSFFKIPQRVEANLQVSNASNADARLTPSNSSNVVSSSVFPRSASEALFDSSSKFQQLPCRTFISVGTCPYRERCVYLHDPRCICREAKTETRRKNKEDVVVDALFWPVMPYSLVEGKLDAQRQPHVIQSYSVPIPQFDNYRSHDQAVYSCWMHFVDFCLANSESQNVSHADAAPCYQAPDLPVNAYTEKERLQIFTTLSRMVSCTRGGGGGHMQQMQTNTTHGFAENGRAVNRQSLNTDSSYRHHQPMTIPSGDSRNLQYPVLGPQYGPTRVSPGNGSAPITPAASLLNLYAESNPLAHTGLNSAMQHQQHQYQHQYQHSPYVTPSPSSTGSGFRESPMRSQIQPQMPHQHQQYSSHRQTTFRVSSPEYLSVQQQQSNVSRIGHRLQQQQQQQLYRGAQIVSPPPLELKDPFASPSSTQQLRGWPQHQLHGGSGDGYPNPSPTAIASMTSPGIATQMRKRFPAIETNPSKSSSATLHQDLWLSTESAGGWPVSSYGGVHVTPSVSSAASSTSPAFFGEVYGVASIARPQPTKANNKLSADAQPFQFGGRSCYGTSLMA